MDNIKRELSEASIKIKKIVTEKAGNVDKETSENIELVQQIRADVLMFAQILSNRFSNCNAKLTCDMGNKLGRYFEIMLIGGEVVVHCPSWYSEGKFGHKFLDEIILDDAKEIAECIIEMSNREDDIRIGLA